jgi:hypothetical protein
MRTVDDVKDYILNTYPLIRPNKFQIAKIGIRVYLYIVDQSANLHRVQIIRAQISTIYESNILKNEFEKNIRNAMKKFGWFNG